MPILLAAWSKLRSDETDASAAEYGLLAAGVAGLIVAVVFLFGDQVTAPFDAIESGADGQMSATF